MSAFAIGAAGMLRHSGRLAHEHEADIEREPQRCPICNERFHVEHLEFHLFIAHKHEAKS